MARTERYTVQQVIAAIEQGHTAYMAGKLLKPPCSGEAIRGYANRHPTIAIALRAQRKDMRDLSENSLRGAITRGEGWAVMGVFKLFDEDGNSIAQNRSELDVRWKNVSELDDDELEAIIKA